MGNRRMGGSFRKGEKKQKEKEKKKRKPQISLDYPCAAGQI